MSTKKTAPKKSTSEVKKEVDLGVSPSTSEVVILTLNEYLATADVHPGLIASYRWEARKDWRMAEPRTLEEWVKAFELQSKQRY